MQKFILSTRALLRPLWGSYRSISVYERLELLRSAKLKPHVSAAIDAATIVILDTSIAKFWVNPKYTLNRCALFNCLDNHNQVFVTPLGETELLYEFHWSSVNKHAEVPTIAMDTTITTEIKKFSRHVKAEMERRHPHWTPTSTILADLCMLIEAVSNPATQGVAVLILTKYKNFNKWFLMKPGEDVPCSQNFFDLRGHLNDNAMKFPTLSQSMHADPSRVTVVYVDGLDDRSNIAYEGYRGAVGVWKGWS